MSVAAVHPSHSIRRWAWRLAGTLAFGGALALVAQRTLDKLNQPGQPRFGEWGLVDFRDAIYFPALAVTDGVNPYDTPRYTAAYPVDNIFPVYAPFTPYLHVPLSLLSFERAELAYCALVAIGTLLLAGLCLHYCGGPVAWGALSGLAAAMLMSRAGHLNFALGQMAVQSALLSLTALHFARTRPKLAGGCLALAMYKPTFGLPLAALMFCRRDFRAVALGILGAAALTLAATALMMATTGGWQQFWDALPGNVAALQNDPLASPLLGWMRIDAEAGLARLTGAVPSRAASLTLSGVIFVAAAVSVWRLSGTTAGVGADSLSAAIICLATSTVVYHLMYDLLWLFGPIVAVLAGRRGEWRALGQLRPRLLAGLMLVPMVNVFLTNGVMARLERGSLAWTFATSVNSIALLAALAWCCWLALRQAQETK